MKTNDRQTNMPGKAAIRRAKTHQRLLDEGLRIMGKQGVSTCKVEEITRAAGVSKGAFFTHFSSKKAYIADLVDLILNDLARRVTPMRHWPPDAQPLFKALVSVHLRFFQLQPQAAAFLSDACLLDHNRETILKRLREHIDLVSDLIAPTVASLGWPRSQAGHLALALFSLSCGHFWLGSRLGLPDIDSASLPELLAQALAAGLIAPDNQV